MSRCRRARLQPSMCFARNASRRSPASAAVIEKVKGAVSRCASKVEGTLSELALPHGRASDTLLLLARGDDGVRRQLIVNELVDVRFDQFAVNDPGFLSQHVARRIAFRRIEKNVPGRSPTTGIAS